jgi:hypothetical protein
MLHHNILILCVIISILLKFYLENSRVQEIRRFEEEENRRFEEEENRRLLQKEENRPLLQKEENRRLLQEEENRRLLEEESNRDITGFEKFMIYCKLVYIFDMLFKILFVFKNIKIYVYIVFGIYCFSALISFFKIKKSSILYKTFQIIDYKYIIPLALLTFIILFLESEDKTIQSKSGRLILPIPLPALAYLLNY